MAGLGRRSHYRKHLTDAVLHDLPEPDESLGQRIARVVGTRGGNMFDVVVAPLSASIKEPEEADAADDNAGQSSAEGEVMPKLATGENGKRQPADTDGSPPPIGSINLQRAPQLAFLPTKFRKLVWIKRNDFVIVECGEEEEEGAQKESSGGFRYVINHILYKEQVKHIKSKGLWPTDPFFADDIPPGPEEAGTQSEKKDSEKEDNEELDHDAEEPQYGSGAYEDNGIVFDDPLDDDMMVNTNRIATLRVEDSSSDEDSD